MATGGGFLLAGIPAAIAGRQLWYSKQSRIDQNRPYIVVTFDPGIATFNAVDIEIRNVGMGPARDVRIEVDPPLRRAKEIENMPLAATRYFNKEISMMPPGYKLRTFFDMMDERQVTDLPDRYTFTISYHDGHGHHWTETTEQDLGILNELLFTETYTVHHAAKALREVAQAIQASPLIKGRVDATTETRSDRTAREHQARAERQRMIAERLANEARRKAAQESSGASH